MRAAAVLAASLSLAAPAASVAAPARVPPWVTQQARLFAFGLGDPSPRIVLVRLNQREHGRLVDHVWLRGDFTCNVCMPRQHTRAELSLDVRTHGVVSEHIYG
jgi:hypothetical protein